MFNFSSFYQDTAIITPEDKYTYRDLQTLSDEIGKHLISHQLLFLLCNNDIESITGYIASLEKDTVVLPLNADTDEEIIENLKSIYNPRFIWKPLKLLKKEDRVIYHYKGYILIETEYKKDPPLPSNLSLLLSTSGSTGSPKLVRLTKNNLISNAKSIIEYLNITGKERPVTSLPMYYSFGLSVINSHLMAGATILLTNFSYIQADFWKFANENQFTSFSGVPYTFEILKKIKFWSMSFPTLKTITQAGGKMDNGLLKFFIENAEERNIRFISMYGQTEATARMSYLPPQFGLSKLGSIGKAIPNGMFHIQDDNGILLGDEQIGEIIYEGPNVCLGYAENLKDLYRDDENNGILHTGDLGYKDKEGFYFITGRKKRFLKLSGNRISLDYVEELLKDKLNEAVCTGDDRTLTVFTTDQEYNEDDIIDFLANRLKLIHTCFKIKKIDSIPRNETGKIQYSNLV